MKVKFHFVCHEFHHRAAHSHTPRENERGRERESGRERDTFTRYSWSRGASSAEAVTLFNRRTHTCLTPIHSPQLHVLTFWLSSSSRSSSASCESRANIVSNKNFPVRFNALAVNGLSVLLCILSLVQLCNRFSLPYRSQFVDVMSLLTACTQINLFSNTIKARKDTMLSLNCVHAVCFAFIFSFDFLIPNSSMHPTNCVWLSITPSSFRISPAVDSCRNRRTGRCNLYFLSWHLFLFLRSCFVSVYTHIHTINTFGFSPTKNVNFSFFFLSPTNGPSE